MNDVVLLLGPSLGRTYNVVCLPSLPDDSSTQSSSLSTNLFKLYKIIKKGGQRVCICFDNFHFCCKRFIGVYHILIHCIHVFSLTSSLSRPVLFKHYQITENEGLRVCLLIDDFNCCRSRVMGLFLFKNKSS